MKLKGIRRIALALALGLGAITAMSGVGQHSVVSAPARHGLAGEAMPPIPQVQSITSSW